jgi:hypothetical protein
MDGFHQLMRILRSPDPYYRKPFRTSDIKLELQPSNAGIRRRRLCSVDSSLEENMEFAASSMLAYLSHVEVRGGNYYRVKRQKRSRG